MAIWQEAIELSDGGALLLTTSRWAVGFQGIMAARETQLPPVVVGTTCKV